MQLNILITIPEKGEPIVAVEPTRRKEQPPRQCLQCNETFIPFRSNQKFCSDSHGALYRKHMSTVKAEIQKTYTGRNKVSPNMPVPNISRDPFYQEQLQKAAKKRPQLYKTA